MCERPLGDQTQLCVVRRARGDAALNLRHDSCGKRSQYFDVSPTPVARALIESAQRAKDVSILGCERYSRISPDFGVPVSESGLVPRVCHDERNTLSDDVLAERCVERIPASRRGTAVTGYAFEALAFGVDERDQNRGDGEQLRREARENVQAVVCGCLEKSCIMESSEPDGACQCVIVGQEVIAEKRSRTLSDEQRMVPDTVLTRQYCKNHSKQGRLRRAERDVTERDL